MKAKRFIYFVLILALFCGSVSAAAAAKKTDHSASPPKGVSDQTEAAGVPSWGLGPFVRCPENPLLESRSDTSFFCPILKTNVAWESRNIVGAATAVKDGRIHWLYRTEPMNCKNSRVGLATSEDGVHFNRLPVPVLYPDEDEFKQYEWSGGTEDGRIAQRQDGLYIYLYAAYDGKKPRQAVASSRDLVHWTKHGLAFAKAYDGKYKDISKGGSVVSRYYDDGRVVAEKINGKYWMYCIHYEAAYSEDCINWTPVLDAQGKPIRVLPTREGKFDSHLTEPGPNPIVTPNGILVLYHGHNDSKKGDPTLPANTYSGGQALFDLKDPTKLLDRCDSFFITPRMPYELDNAIGCPVTFMEGLVRFNGKWLLYYEAGDHCGAMAVCDKPGFETNSAAQPSASIAPVFQIGGENTDLGRCVFSPDDWKDLGKQFPGDTQFTVGRDKAPKNWTCIHPGPKADWAGSRPHSFEIIFNLDAVPVEADLRIATLDADCSPDPRLNITCNGQSAGQLTFPGGLWLMPKNAGRNHNRPYDLLLTIPGKMLKTGQNRIALTLVESNWIVYDGIRLDARITPAPAVRLVRATANPAQADRSGSVLQQYVVLDLQNNGESARVPIIVDGSDFSSIIGPGRRTRVVKIPTDEKGRRIQVSVDGETAELTLAPVMPSPRPEPPKAAIGAEPLAVVPAGAAVLHEGWHIQSSVIAGSDGAVISQPDFNDASWVETSVPTSVLSALVRKGIYPDPYDGMNNLLIPDAHPGYSRRHNLDRFSHLPDGSNPWQKPWWFRKTFVGTKEQASGTTWLNLDGLNYRADIWLNGTKIADAKDAVGMFCRFRYSISKLIRPGETNVLAIAVHPLDHPGDPVHECQFGAANGHGPNGGDAAITLDVTHSFVVVWDWNVPTRDRNVGLWQHVWLETTGPVAVRNPAMHSEFDAAAANEARLTLRFRADNPGPASRQVPLTIQIQPENFKGKSLSVKTTVNIPPGMDHEVVLTSKEIPGLVLNNPRLWWPRNYGEPSLYRVGVTACNEAGKASSTATALAGIRKIGTFVLPSGGRAFTVNGRTIRMTGGHFVPDSSMNWDAQRYRDEVRLMAEGNHSIVRINGCGIIPPDVLLDACDREGLLVWMDMARTSVSPGSDRYDKKDDRGPAAPDTGVYLANMEDSIVRIRSHPSLLLYCGCNEQPAAGEGPRLVQDELLPRLDPGAMYFSNSGDKKSPWAKEEHHWTSFGPYNLVPLTYYFEEYQKNPKFVCKNEIGLQSLPPINSVMSFIPDAPSADGFVLTDGMGYHEAFWNEATPEHGSFKAIGRPATLNDYLWMGQVINAQHYRAIFDAANRARPRNAGTHLWKINAAWGSWMWQVYDWYLRPNAGYWTMKAACRPLNCAYSLPDRGLQVVSVLDTSFAGTLRARLFDSTLKEIWKQDFSFTVAADSTLAIGDVPETIASGPLYWLRLELLNKKGLTVAQTTYWQSGTSGWQGDGLANLAVTDVSARVLSRKSIGDEDQLCIEAAASKANTAPAFLCQIEVTDGPLGSEVLPSFWDDNALILLPGETRELTVRYRRGILSLPPYLMVEGWNVRPRCVSVDGNKELQFKAMLSGPQPVADGRVAFTLTQTADSRRYVTWPMELDVNGQRTVVRFAAYGKIPATAVLELPTKP